jgi:hypothetical protein
MTRSRPRWLLGVAAIVGLGLGLLFIHRCADGGAMASAYRACECRGIEWVQYDRTAADGPRRTICFDLIASTTCYRSRGGELTACP